MPRDFDYEAYSLRRSRDRRTIAEQDKDAEDGLFIMAATIAAGLALAAILSSLWPLIGMALR